MPQCHTPICPICKGTTNTEPKGRDVLTHPVYLCLDCRNRYDVMRRFPAGRGIYSDTLATFIHRKDPI